MALRSPLVIIVLGVVFVAGCKSDEPAAQFVVEQVRELGALPQPASIRGRDGGYSGRFAGRSVWLYGDTILAFAGEDGTSWRNNTASTTTDLDASDGLTGFVEQTDAKGAPREFFPQTATEAAFNHAHSEVLLGKDGCTQPCGARWALWPGPLVEDAARQRALIVYTKIYGEPGAWNFHSVGMGIATWAGHDQPVLRPEVAPGAEHPTLLFGQKEQNFASAAVVQGEDVYLFGCHGQDKGCRLARVPLAQVHVRAAWRFYAGGDVWSVELADAKALFAAMDMTSVHYNAHLGQWLAIYSPPFDNRVVGRTAPQLTGPWSAAVTLATAQAPYQAGEYAYSGLGHAELARDGGRVEIISYYRSTAPWQGEVRLVELTLAQP